jgi:prevent-host-death family protein
MILYIFSAIKIRFSMNIYTVTEARKKIFQLIDNANQHHEPILVKSKRGNVVILAKEDYEGLLETLHLLSIRGMEKSIMEGSQEPLEDCAEWTDEI